MRENCKLFCVGTSASQVESVRVLDIQSAILMGQGAGGGIIRDYALGVAGRFVVREMVGVLREMVFTTMEEKWYTRCVYAYIYVK